MLIPHGAYDSPEAIQCVASMEKRDCLMRRAGADTQIKALTGFYVCGVYCAKPLRGNGMATNMMCRLIQGCEDGGLYAKVQDPHRIYPNKKCVPQVILEFIQLNLSIQGRNLFLWPVLHDLV